MDEYAAGIVKEIFEWKISGMAVSAIADRLNQNGILSPESIKILWARNIKAAFLVQGIPSGAAHL
ncbi:hypothetical protein C823_007523 [Eubacterium plexicaudatum ASF492]|nr:hypothetical protein C823_007523 [Eubacterium plexicaudatum ASF492]